MKRLLVFFALFLVGAGCQRTTNDLGITFYLQLLRGNNLDTPPVADAKPIGSKLNDKLHSMCKWKHYWELRRASVIVKTGQHVRRRMSTEREVEIELKDTHRILVRNYVNGMLTQSQIQPAEAAFYIVGGDKGENQSWFIVVRRDRPLDSNPD